MSSQQRQFLLRYCTGWQQVHEHLVKKTEVSLTVLPAGGLRVTYRRRAVNFMCARYLVDARSGFCSGCGQPLSAFRERPWEQKTRARVGRHHGSQTCTMVLVIGVTAVTLYLVLVLLVPPRLT